MTEQNFTSDVTERAAEGKTPSRRCICCRGNGAKFGLLRFGVMNGMLVFDLRHKMPGRGYYLCATPTCLEKAWKTGFKKILKADVSSLAPTWQEFVQTLLVPAYQKRYREYLLAGRQSGQLILGSDAVEQAAQEDRLACYLLATDASDATRKKYVMNAERKQLPVYGRLSRDEYGKLLGSGEKVVLGWLSGSELALEFEHVENVLNRFETSEN